MQGIYLTLWGETCGLELFLEISDMFNHFRYALGFGYNLYK